MSLADIFIALFVALLWGGNYVAAKIALVYFPAICIMAVRVTIVAMILVPFIKRPNISWSQLCWLSFANLVGHHCLLFTAVAKGLSLSATVIISQLNVPLASIFSWWLLKEKLSMKKIAGMCIAFAGIIFIVGSPDLKGHMFEFILALGGATFLALFYTMLKKAGEMNIVSFVAWSSLVAIPQLFILSYLFEPLVPALTSPSDLNSKLAIAYMAMTTVVGFGLWFHLMQKYPVNTVIPFSLLVPVFGILLSNIILKDSLSIHVILGGLITIFGVMIIVLKTPSILQRITMANKANAP